MKKYLLFLMLVLGSTSLVHAQVAVIVHPNVPVTELSERALLDIYALDQMVWSDGSRVAAFTLDAEADKFYGGIGRSHNDMKKLWLRKKLSGEGQPPDAVESAGALVKRVASTPGAIGFVPASAVDGSVRVVATLK